MKRLLIVGAGGHGRCCLDIARDMNIYDEINFLDDSNVNGIINDAKIVGSIQDMDKYINEYPYIFIAIGNNIVRKELCEKAETIGFELVNLISSKSVVSPYASISKGTVIFPNAVLEANTSIGDGCILCANTSINHDAIIENFVLINTNTVIRPNTHIGAYSRIGSSCTVVFGTKLEECCDIKDGSVVEPMND